MATTSPKRFFVILIMSVIAALALRDYLIERVFVASASMEPTLPVGSVWWVDKLSLRLSSLRRQEIIVCASPVTEEKDLIKRVIAIGGDNLEIRNKTVFVNNERLSEPYIQHTRANETLVGDNLGPLKVPEGHFFVMGDNRDESGDSRDWKDPATGRYIYFLPKNLVKGRLIGASK